MSGMSPQKMQFNVPTTIGQAAAHEGPQRVKSGKAQNKQMFSGLRRKADTRGVYECTPYRRAFARRGRQKQETAHLTVRPFSFELFARIG
jgi:hypothetical protein